jgi:hypothetical protein
MPNSRYQIQYRDKSGQKHTINDVSNIKDVIGPLEGEGATGFVVLKQDANGKTEAPTTKSNIQAYDAMNGKGSSKDTQASTPPDTSNDAEGAGEPNDSPAEDAAETPAANTEADKKKGTVPAGLAKYIAAKAKGKSK